MSPESFANEVPPIESPRSTPGADKKASRARVIGIVLLAAALVVVVFTRLELARTKTHLEHDEAISVIAATGHDLSFETARVAMSYQWVPVAEWQRYMRVENPFDFAPIEPGLAQTDVAPPLYFWVLHIWLWVFGSSAVTPMLLNIPIALLTALGVTGLMRRVTGSFALASATALVWALTPQAWLLSGMARQYDMFALFSILIVWQSLRFVDEHANPVRDTVLLALVFAGGMLTQYYFAITAVAAGLIILAVALVRREPRIVWRLAIAVAVSVVLFVALNPGVLHAYSNMQSRLPTSRTAAVRRLRIDQVEKVFWPGGAQLLRSWASSVHRVVPFFRWRLLAIAAALLLLALGGLGIARGWLKRLTFDVVSTIFAALWTTVVTVALYVGFVSPPWAMDNRYMASVWALGAAAIVALASTLPRRIVGWVVGAWVVLMLAASVPQLSASLTAKRPDVGSFSTAHHVVIDTNRRGFVTRYLLELPSNAELYVGNAPDLAANPGPWVSRLSAGDLYVQIPGASAASSITPSDVIGRRFGEQLILGTTVERLVPKTN